MAYAELAGLPSRHGLFAAAMAPVTAAFFASSPYLQTGPVALTALLTLGALVPLAAPGSADYVRLAALLALVVGIARVLVGMLKGGWISYMMSRPMLDGFTSAAAILIISSQLPGAAGVLAPSERSDSTGILDAYSSGFLGGCGTRGHSGDRRGDLCGTPHSCSGARSPHRHSRGFDFLHCDRIHRSPGRRYPGGPCHPSVSTSPGRACRSWFSRDS